MLGYFFDYFKTIYILLSDKIKIYGHSYEYIKKKLTYGMIRHVLLSLIASGGLFAFTGFVLTMFGFSSPCNEPSKCNGIDGQRILLYKVCGPILLMFGLLMVMLGIMLKWRLQSEQLRLENRALSTEGTAFTGDTNLDVSTSSPVEESPPPPSPASMINGYDATTTGASLMTKPGLQGGRLISDVRDSRDGEGFSSHSSLFTPLSSSSRALERNSSQPSSPGYADNSKYSCTHEENCDAIKRTLINSNNGDGDNDDYGFDEVDSCAFVVGDDSKHG